MKQPPPPATWTFAPRRAGVNLDGTGSIALVTFERAGTFDHFSSIHPHTRGTVRVIPDS